MITYGEMEYDGIQQLYPHVMKQSPVNCFMDIGSGRGKLCMYMAAQPKIQRVVGIELVKERHDDAIKLQHDLQSDFSDKITLLNKNVMDVSMDEYKQYTLFIWFSNLCFDEKVTCEIVTKLQELPGSILCCSTKMNMGTFIKSVEIPMSWESKSTVYMYRL